jgi:hypothetical protein
MLCSAKNHRLDKLFAVSLETLVSANTFYRHLEATLDLSFVPEWTRDLNAERGRPRIDPVMFFEGIRSECKLINMASLNLAQRWYFGYALSKALPDHSSLNRRERQGRRAEGFSGTTPG